MGKRRGWYRWRTGTMKGEFNLIQVVTNNGSAYAGKEIIGLNAMKQLPPVRDFPLKINMSQARTSFVQGGDVEPLKVSRNSDLRLLLYILITNLT
jgi:hypothetical protein